MATDLNSSVRVFFFQFCRQILPQYERPLAFVFLNFSRQNWSRNFSFWDCNVQTLWYFILDWVWVEVVNGTLRLSFDILKLNITIWTKTILSVTSLVCNLRVSLFRHLNVCHKKSWEMFSKCNLCIRVPRMGLKKFVTVLYKSFSTKRSRLIEKIIVKYSTFGNNEIVLSVCLCVFFKKNFLLKLYTCLTLEFVPNNLNFQTNSVTIALPQNNLICSNLRVPTTFLA